MFDYNAKPFLRSCFKLLMFAQQKKSSTCLHNSSLHVSLVKHWKFNPLNEHYEKLFLHFEEQTSREWVIRALCGGILLRKLIFCFQVFRQQTNARLIESVVIQSGHKVFAPLAEAVSAGKRKTIEKVAHIFRIVVSGQKTFVNVFRCTIASPCLRVPEIEINFSSGKSCIGSCEPQLLFILLQVQAGNWKAHEKSSCNRPGQ